MGVAGGYLLGRTKKLRLALALGGLLAGRKLMSEGQGLQGLMGQGSKLLESNPQLKELQNQVTGHLVEAAREAALVAAASRIEALTKSLQERQQTAGEQGEGADLGSALEGVTGALGLKGKGKGESRSEEEQPQDRGEEESGEEEPGEEPREKESGEQPQDRGAEEESDEEESGEEEPGEEEPDEEESAERPQARRGKGGEGREQESAEEEPAEESGERERSPQRDRLRGRLRRRRPEGSKGSGAGGPRRSASSDDEATPRDVAKKVSAKKASPRPAEKGRSES